MNMIKLRNVAIIAHVDHGKTTLVDALLRQSNTKLHKDLEGTSLIMDSNELEKERGITIFSKNASVVWKGTKINIIDTPGHADFGGEVERVLKMADGCLLLVDAKEGPMPQTRFVLKRALEMGHKVIVVVNKIDKSILRSPDSDLKIDQDQINKVIGKVFDLFVELGADEDAAFFPIVYTSAKNGLAGSKPDLAEMKDISPIFEAILEHVPAPGGDPSKPLQMLATTIVGDNYKGRIATCRIYNGRVTAGQEVTHINRIGEMKKVRLTALIGFSGLDKIDIAEAEAGDIVAIAGIEDINIGETIADANEAVALPLLDIEEPTINMTFSVNSSPFAGKEGEFKTSRQIRERLFKELETDMALKVVDGEKGDWVVSGRGELHLAILIERLRREGYEFQVARPQVITKKIEGKTLEPFEKVFIEVPESYSGVVMQKMGERGAQLQDMTSEKAVVLVEFIIPTRKLFGYRSEFITDTKGTGIINTMFHEFRENTGSSFERSRGSLVAFQDGPTTLYGLTNAQERGTLFISPAVRIYKGQVVGQNSRVDDIKVNVCKEKQQTNMRSKGEGVSEHFNAPKLMGLEEALEYIDDSELVEVTPENIRIRKIDLNSKY
ncbi:MAG: GTP-binding protein TypA [Candidatus Woykebacteria bacterium RIFCSPHIGHO2_12_FULL_45_10]|uniref:50S ribosomal subunit assembly factor BipA n=1 Tax=Candidatus Woykebacteria bacterium RIFCSPHIGHO2_12_FULL_45_10 TaxID=1802603 RepID=A0A1G1WT14_9BACT|nr:MAG: GTP-binding protein TypA [Candidatus Woykebacteria bacterium RIFCSPHIGHO2_12_FULL_45_10]